MSNIVLHGIDNRLDKLLEDTHYQLIYQEQVMIICMQLAGYSLGEADKIRKTIGRKIQSELDKEIPKLKQGFLDNGMKESSADTLCRAIQVCGSYSFNKAHAVEYGLISYQTAYLKANYPLQYMCSLLNGNIDSEDDVIKYINECKRMDIKILPPSIKAGNMRFEIEDNSIRVGLAYLKGINNLEYTYYNSITMFFMHNKLNKRIKEALIKSGAMDCFGVSRNELFAVAFDVQTEINKEYEKIQANQSKIKSKEYEISTSKQGTKKIGTLKKQIDNLNKAIDKSKAHITELKNTYTNDYDEVQGEIDILGFTFKDKYVDYNTDYITYNPDNITNQIIIGEVIDFKKHTDKNGNQMAFVKIVPHNSYQYDFVMFARNYKELSNGIYVFKINRGNIIVDVAEPQKK